MVEFEQNAVIAAFSGGRIHHGQQLQQPIIALTTWQDAHSCTQRGKMRPFTPDPAPPSAPTLARAVVAAAPHTLPPLDRSAVPTCPHRTALPRAGKASSPHLKANRKYFARSASKWYETGDKNVTRSISI